MKLAECHPSRKEQARGLCKNCYDKWLKENNPIYKASQAKNTQDWLEKNQEKNKISNEKRRIKQLNDPHHKLRRRNSYLKKEYSITHEDYEKMLKQQNNGCAICFRKPGEGKYLHVDHCHKTGNIRGLLCHQCNWYLGTIEADPGLYKRISFYLNNSRYKIK